MSGAVAKPDAHTSGDPIGTAQERELIERLEDEEMRLSGRSIDRGCVDSGLAANLAREVSDALQSRIAEVERLTEALRELVGAVERRWPDSDFSTSQHFAEPMNQARAALNSRSSEG